MDREQKASKREGEGVHPDPSPSPDGSQSPSDAVTLAPSASFFSAALPPHWVTADGGKMAREYAAMDRSSLTMPDLSDFALANAVFMASRDDLSLIAYQTAAKERIRWLSVRLALAEAALQRADGHHG